MNDLYHVTINLDLLISDMFVTESIKSVFVERRVWRYQRGNQNLYIEEEQTTQWVKEKVQKDKPRSPKHTHKTKARITETPLKTGSELRCSGRVSSIFPTSDTRRVNLVTNPVISREWGRDREVLTTSGTYPWSFVTQVFHNSQPSHCGDFNFTKGNPWFSCFPFSSNSLSGKSWYEPQALEYRINWEIYTPYAGAAGMLQICCQSKTRACWW